MTEYKTVPVEPTEAMIEAGNRALSPWVAPAMHAGDAYRAMLAAAPAVQPAAGREEIEKLIAEASDFTERMISQPWACELIERLVAALAHPPAQGSESGREDKVKAFDAIRELCGYVENGSSATFKLSQDEATRNWTAVSGNRWHWGRSPTEAIAKLQASLAQPGPAPEGDGE